MKDFNTKFKSIGYELVIENSTQNHNEYLKIEEGSYKRIAITYNGVDEKLSIQGHELIKNYAGELIEISTFELNQEEWDAINTLIKDTDFENEMYWDDENNVYIHKKRRKNGNNKI